PSVVPENPFAELTEPTILRQPPLPPEPGTLVTPRPKQRLPRWRPLSIGAAVALAAVVAGIVLLLPTKNGVLRIEINDPAIEVAVGATRVTIKGTGKEDITVEPGEKSLKVKRGDLEFETGKFVLKKGETVTLKIEVLDGKV